MSNVKEIKQSLDPIEIRIRRVLSTDKYKGDNEFQFQHPFYHMPNYYNQVVLIGEEKELPNAEEKITEFFNMKRTNYKTIVPFS